MINTMTVETIGHICTETVDSPVVFDPASLRQNRKNFGVAPRTDHVLCFTT